jgi:hypothetical protein
MSKSKGKSSATTTTPKVNISTGVVTNGPIYVNQQFQFVSASTTETCTVIAPPSQQWFSPSPCPVSPNPGYATVTAKLPNPAGWTYSVTGCIQANPNPRVPVSSGRP